LWGANAVNGIINIITKDARDTQGGLVSAGAGNKERGFGALRYGGALGDDAYWRVYGKYLYHDDFRDLSGRGGGDSWDVLRGGFRLDWEGAEDRLKLQGDLYEGDLGQTVSAPVPFPPVLRTYRDEFDIAGGNLLGRWVRATSEASELAIQAYYDRTVRQESIFGEARHTFDVALQHRFSPHPRHEILWGLGYRYTTDNVTNMYAVSLDPKRRSDNLFSAFFHDTVTLVEDRLRLTLGTMIEHNDYSGLEVQPTARLSWTPSERHTLWAAVSRAVQVPSRGFHDMRLNIVRFPGAVMAIIGDTRSESEDLWAFEIGHRIRITDRFFVDSTAFYNRYDDLRTHRLQVPFPELLPLPPHFVIPLMQENGMEGRVYGVELMGNWQVTDGWQLAAGYTYLQMDLGLKTADVTTSGATEEGESPQHQVQVQSHLDLPHHIEFDTMAYYADHLPALDIPSYVRVDVRLGWHPSDALEFSVCVQNLFDKRHQEFDPIEGVVPSSMNRSIYGKLIWRF